MYSLPFKRKQKLQAFCFIQLMHFSVVFSTTYIKNALPSVSLFLLQSYKLFGWLCMQVLFLLFFQILKVRCRLYRSTIVTIPWLASPSSGSTKSIQGTDLSLSVGFRTMLALWVMRRLIFMRLVVQEILVASIHMLK